MKKIFFKVLVAVAYLFSMTAAFEFLNNFGAFVNFPAGVLIALLLGICYCAVFAISGSVAASVISVNIVWETLYVVNFYRLRMTSIPFRPADLAMVSKAGQLTAFYKITIEPEAVISVLAVAALTVLFIKIFGKLYTSLRSRMICMNSVLVVFTVVFLSGSYTKVLGNPLSLPIADRYLQNGAMLGFLMSARSEDKPTEIIYGGSEHVVSKPKTSIEKNNTVVTPPPDNSSPTDPPVAEPLPPILISDRSVKKAVQPEVTFPGTLDEEGIIEEIKIPDISSVGEEITLDENTSYTKELMDSIAAYVKNNIIAPKASSNIRPNIIVIQSEAFTDPTLWENVYFSEDPISTVHKLQKNFYSGNIITPSFGGGTCDPEYEMLTGNSFQFITRGDMPFTNPEVYANSPDPRSFPNILKQNGYSTVGIHTYGGSMIFDRKAIYPLLGFDKFIAEEDMSPPESAYKANEYNNVKFLSDEYFTDQIINVFDETEQPLFLFGISMENHFDYFREKFDVYNVVAESKFLNAWDSGVALAYTQGVYDASRQLGRLINYVEESNEPTIIFFYGDHHPLLSEGNRVYDSLGVISDSDVNVLPLDEKYNMWTTPYVCWSNYDIDAYNMSDMSSYFIGANILDAAGIPKNLYFEFLSKAYQSFNAVTPRFSETKSREVIYYPQNSDKLILELWKWIQYDAVYGEKYAYEEFSQLLQ